MNSMKTTIAGIVAIVAVVAQGLVVLLDGDPETVVNLELLLREVTGIAIAYGLLQARDNDVSSEEAGAR